MREQGLDWTKDTSSRVRPVCCQSIGHFCVFFLDIRVIDGQMAQPG
jgi:hypothetical protein